MSATKRKASTGKNQHIIIVLEVLVIALSVLCVWLIMSSPECEPCKKQVEVGCSDVNASSPQCFGERSCHLEQNQTLLIEYYSDNNFTVTRQDSQGNTLEDTITTQDIMREFGEKNIRGEGPIEKRKLSEYQQYLCLVAANATDVSCMPAAIFW